MKTILFVALALLVAAPLVAPVASAHHGGWTCVTPSPAEACVARTIYSNDDCIVRLFGMEWCW